MNFIKDFLYDPIKNTFLIEDNDNMYFYCNINQAVKGLLAKQFNSNSNSNSKNNSTSNSKTDIIKMKLNQMNLINTLTTHFSNSKRRLLLINGKTSQLKALDTFNDSPNTFKALKHKIYLLPLIDSSILYYDIEPNKSIQDALSYFKAFLFYYSNEDTVIRIDNNKSVKKPQEQINAGPGELYLTKTKDIYPMKRVHSQVYICPVLQQYQQDVSFMKKQRYEQRKKMQEQSVFLPSIKQFSSRLSSFVDEKEEEEEKEKEKDGYGGKGRGMRKDGMIHLSRVFLKDCKTERKLLEGYNEICPKEKMKFRLRKGVRNITNKKIYDYEEMIFQKANPITSRKYKEKELYELSVLKRHKELLLKKLSQRKKHDRISFTIEAS